MGETETLRPAYKVRFSDRGDWVREFTELLEALRFAKRNRYQGGKAVIETRRP